jgi:SSS family transporter
LPPALATRLSPLDLALVAIYLVAITIFGLRFAKRAKKSGSLKTYFLANNTIPWWAIALSIVSAETSTLTIVSIPGVAFAGDLGFLQLVLGYMLGRIVVALLFLPRYFRGEMLTAYQLIDQRFGAVLHKVTAGLFLCTRAAAEGVRVFAISIVVSIAIGTGDTLSIAIISALTLLYTFEGGMAAVIWTDVVQMALYVVGTLIAVATLGTHVGWTHIVAVAAPLGKFHMLNFALNLTTTYTFWAGVLGGTFLTMASHGTDQLMVQRMLAARNLRESRLALLSSGVVIFLQFTLFLLIGVGLFVFYATHPTHFRSNDYIFPTFIVQQMPRGIAGLLIAAILAAAMSNLSAALNSLSSTTVVDFYLPWHERKNRVILSGARSAQSKDLPVNIPATESPGSQATNTLVSRLSTVLWALILFAIAVYSIHAGGKGHVVETGLSIASVAYGCLLGVFLLGTLTRYATQMGTTLAMLCGFALNLWLWQGTFPVHIGPLMIPHIAYTWYVLIGALATFALGLLFSAILPKPRRAATIAAALVLSVFGLSSHSLFGLSFRGFAEESAFPQSPSPTTPDFSEVSTAIDTAIAEKKLPGAVVLIGHNGHIVFNQAYGVRKLAGEPGLDGKPSPAEPMTLDTIFDMASLTKVIVTTTAILQLYEQDKLDLDAPVAKYLPEFAAPSPSPEEGQRPDSYQPGAKPQVTAPAQPQRAEGPTQSRQTLTWKSQITIRQLMTHYSGLPEDVNLKDDWGLKSPDKAEGIRRAMASVPYGPPGQTFKYSDINFITLGALVEKLSGEDLYRYSLLHIFVPLKMYPTSYRPLAHDWPSSERVPDIAPTAHDNEGTALTNPDFDHLLRGTVHDPTTRRMGGVAGHAGLFSTAADMSLFCRALLDKLLHNTGPFPLKQSTLQLATSPQAPANAHSDATIFTATGEPTKGVAQRGLGWDINSPYSRPRGAIFPIGSFGHTGFTGTSLWLDPASDTYVILLANAIHPRGNPPISALRGQVATAAARALGLSNSAQLPVPHPREVRVGGSGTDLPGDHLDPEMLESGIARPSYPSTTGDSSGAPSFAPSAKGGVSSEARPSFDPSHPCAPPVICDSFGAHKGDIPQPQHSFTAPTFLPASQGKTSSKIYWAIDPNPSHVLTGIDVLEQTQFSALTPYHRIGLLTNQSGIDSQSRRTIDILNQTGKLTLLFTPEHGLSARQDTELLHPEQDTATKLTIRSLYGPKSSDKHPRQSDLKSLDAIVIDLPDAGVRFWTYETVLGYFLEDCARAHVPVIVLDRPNPIGGIAFGGPISDPGSEMYSNFMPMPVRHGMTFGELARFFNANARQSYAPTDSTDPDALHVGPDSGADASGSTIRPPATQPGLHAALTVIPLQHWRRSEYFAETGLPWVPPSPNMKTPATNIVYPGVALMESTNMSVGRGSSAPYENFGAPFLKADELAAYLTARQIPGVTFTASTLTIAETPEKYPFHGQTIPAIHLTVTDPAALDSPEMGVELLSALHRLYPKEFQLDKAGTIVRNAATLEAIRAGRDPRDIAATWAPALKTFRDLRRQALLYP